MVKQDQEKRNALVEEYSGFVKYVARTLIHSMGLPQVHYEEYESAGYLGLVEAANRYNFARGKKFKTYAYFRIRGSIIDSIRESNELSGRAYKSAKAYKAVQQLREEDFSSQDAEEYKSKENNEKKATSSKAKLAKIMDFAAKGALAYRLSMQDLTEQNQIACPASTPEEAISEQQELNQFQTIVQSLPEKERLIITEYYYNNKSFSDIARDHALVSKSWVSRLHSRALSILKERYEELQVKD